MYRIDNSTAAAVMPVVGAVGPKPNSFFTVGSAVGGVPATVVDADWLNNVQEELMSVLTAANIAGDKTKVNLLYLSILAIIGANDSNPVINSGCIYGSLTFGRPTASLSTSMQYAGVDRWAVAATNGTPTAGTIQQEATALLGQSGYSLSILGYTITGAGVIAARYRIEARDVLKYKGLAAIIASLDVYHDCAAAINYTVTLNTPNAIDNFSAVTTIGNAVTLVQPLTDTVISATLAPGANIINGLEIIVSAATGAQAAAKNLRFNQLQTRSGNVIKTYQPQKMADTIKACEWYYERFGNGACGFYINGAQLASLPVSFRTTKRIVPTCSVITGTVSYKFAANTGVTCSNMGASSFDQAGGTLSPTTSGAGAVSTPIQITSNSPYQADAEL